MTEFLEQNLRHLRRLDLPLAALVERAALPEAAHIMDAKNGQPTLVMGGVTFHSRINPEAEGVKMADAAREAAAAAGKAPGFFGLGLGWHVLALAKQTDLVMVVEPDPGMVRLALTCLDFGPLLSRIRFLLTTDDLESPSQLVLMPHPPSARMHQGAYRTWTRVFEQGVETARETAEDLAARLGALPGATALLNGLDHGHEPGLKDLVHLVQQRHEPLTETEIYILLLKELQL